MRQWLLAMAVLAFIYVNAGCGAGPDRAATSAAAEVSSEGSEETSYEGSEEDFDSSLDSLSAEVCKAVLSSGKEELRIAVYYFAFSGEDVNPLGEYIAAALPAYIKKHSADKIKVFSRRKLDQARDELALQSQILFSRESTAGVGKLLGANLIVCGDVFDKGKAYELGAETIEVASGEIILTSRVKFVKTDEVKSLATGQGLAAADPADAAESSALGSEGENDIPAYVEEGSSAEIEVQKGDFFLDRGQPETALAYYSKAEKQGGSDSRVYYRIGRANLLKGDTAAAEKYFGKAGTRGTEKVSDLLDTAFAYIRRKDYPKAQKVFERALELRPGYLRAREGLGIVKYHEGRTREAEALLLSVLQSNPRYPVAQFYLGRIRFQQRRWQESRVLLTSFLKQASAGRYAAMRAEAKKLLAEIEKKDKRRKPDKHRPARPPVRRPHIKKPPKRKPVPLPRRTGLGPLDLIVEDQVRVIAEAEFVLRDRQRA